MVEEGTATHSNILVWRIPWIEEPGGLQSVGSQRVRHDWIDLVRRAVYGVTKSQIQLSNWTTARELIYNGIVVSSVQQSDSVLHRHVSILVCFSFKNFLFYCCYRSVAQSCLILCDPTYCSPPGSSVHRILQTRILEWVAIHFSRESSRPRDWTLVSHIADWFFIV